jgi:hypothetical protein
VKLFPNEAGGQTAVLDSRDVLDDLPESHRDMITPALRRAFADPAQYFRDVADRAEFSELAEWLRSLVSLGDWRLLVHEGFMCDRATLAAFYWRSSTVLSAMISLPQESLSPRLLGIEAFRKYFKLVDVVHWKSFGCSGGLLGSEQQIPLVAFSTPRPKRKGFDPKKCVVWGTSACGDMLIYTNAGKAGFLSHKTGKVQSLGTIEEAIGWVFRQLLENRTPEFDYGS